MKKVVSLGLHICDILGRPVDGIPPGQPVGHRQKGIYPV